MWLGGCSRQERAALGCGRRPAPRLSLNQGPFRQVGAPALWGSAGAGWQACELCIDMPPSVCIPTACATWPGVPAGRTTCSSGEGEHGGRPHECQRPSTVGHLEILSPLRLRACGAPGPRLWLPRGAGSSRRQRLVNIDTRGGTPECTRRGSAQELLDTGSFDIYMLICRHINQVPPPALGRSCSFTRLVW